MSTPILPREKGAAPLDVVIAVMAFLAALALGASLIAERSAEGWRAGLAGRLTVQVLPPARAEAFAPEVEAALAVLRQTPGIAYANALSEQDTLDLVAPWLGKDKLVAELPMPKLIDATIVPGSSVNLALLTSRLKVAAPDAVLDDHSHWIARLKSLADTVVWSAYGILLLIAVATAAAISFATRAGLQAHHEIVELLHQMGAQSNFIARSFERHYFLSALGAAAVGAASAGILFIAAGGLEFAGIDAVPFLPPLALKLPEVPWLIAVPVVSGLIAWGTARISVLAVLRGIY
jgi:cell division transport system permease protein